MSTKLLNRFSKPQTCLFSTLAYQPTILSQNDINNWHNKGYYIAKNLFDNEEINILQETIEKDKILQNREYTVDDGDGNKAGLVIWKYLSNDTYGAFMGSNRMVNICKDLLNGDIYHYHTKLIRKHARTGGAFCWHQVFRYIQPLN